MFNERFVFLINKLKFQSDFHHLLVQSKNSCSTVSICHLNESKKVAETLSIFSPQNSNLLSLKTIFDPTGNQLGIIEENRMTICDVEDSGKELKVS